MILSTLILPMTTMYQRPRQVETEAQGRLFQAEIIQSVADEKPSQDLVRRAWERLKRTWQFGWWPSVAAILEAIREERKLMPAPPPAPPGTPRVGYTAPVSPSRLRDIFETELGRQCVEAGLGSVLLTSFIETGKVVGPQDLTQDVINRAERIRSRFDIAMRDAEARFRAGNRLMAAMVNMGLAILERDERLKAQYLPGYTAKTFRREAFAPASNAAADSGNWQARAAFLPMRPPARAEEPPPIATVPDGPPADAYLEVF
jgi:hypothetical protein